MKGFKNFCCRWFVMFFCEVIHLAGKPLQSGSPVRVLAVARDNVILPCGFNTSVDLSLVKAMEWLRVDTPTELTVHVLRDGQELVKEKAAEFVGRTAIMKNGSLKLLNVTRRDSGTYRCVLTGPAKEEEVSLIVVEVPEVGMNVRRTSAGELFVGCESGGWSSEPRISLLDARRNLLPAETRSSVGPDNLYSVRAQTNVAAAGGKLTGNGTLICRVEGPGTSLVKENTIYITDEFSPAKMGLGCYIALVCVITLVVVVIFLPIPIIAKLRGPLQRLKDFYIGRIRPERTEQDQLLEGDHGYKEYGDINKVETTGASEETIRVNHLCSEGEHLTGVEASNRLAQRDVEKMLKYKENIDSVGKTLHVHPALIAAIISRQSQAGAKLRSDGYGEFDPNCFGLMQINRHYHAVKGDPCSKDHVDQGVTFFIQLIKTMQRTKKDWSAEQQLKGALACYIAGEDKVIDVATPEDVDSVTPYRDFANDVVARAHWFARNGF